MYKMKKVTHFLHTMKGIVLAGGKATRLRPLTLITSKQLLPVYNKPMIYYPIETLIKAGIKDILIIIAPDYSGQFLNLLGDGSDFGARFNYAIQKEPRGLADAFIVGQKFIDNDNVALILGDNIFDYDFSSDVADFKSGALTFIKQVPDPERSGVVEIDKDMKVLSIEEKPAHPKSNYVSVGFYVYDSRVVNIASNLKPSARGEIEINGTPSINNTYLDMGELKAKVIDGLWEDAGTFDSLLRVSNIMAEKSKQL
jgi:glucose-1-phosphate thymidylyltransferase